jgi:hypothetical protein
VLHALDPFVGFLFSEKEGEREIEKSPSEEGNGEKRKSGWLNI